MPKRLVRVARRRRPSTDPWCPRNPCEGAINLKFAARISVQAASWEPWAKEFGGVASTFRWTRQGKGCLAGRRSSSPEQLTTRAQHWRKQKQCS